MKLPSWLSDTIARRFAVTATMAVAVALALVFLFNTFGGVWSREPLDRLGLLGEAADMVRIMEAAPPSARQALARAAGNKMFGVDWYAAASVASALLEARKGGIKSDAARTIAADMQRPVVALKPDSPQPVPPEIAYERGKSGMPYILAVRLNDRSWLVFTVPSRIWGVSRAARWAIWLSFLAVSIAVATALAARQFSRPVQQLAAAVHQFGIDPQAPPIPETGPKELRQVISTFNAMQAQIQKFVAYRTMMLAAISHDLRSPLTRMRLRGELIEDPEQQARLFRDVDEMQTMVDGALALFRDDAIAEATTTFDLSHVLLTIANDCANQKVDVAYTGPAHAVYHGRPFALKRAVTNLVENAIKYGTAPEIELFFEGAGFVLLVRDRGPGIPHEALENVFRPYYRLDRSRNRATGGVGLGLTVAQAIIQGHGGEITLTNRPEGGVEARVTLPMRAR